MESNTPYADARIALEKVRITRARQRILHWSKTQYQWDGPDAENTAHFRAEDAVLHEVSELIERSADNIEELRRITAQLQEGLDDPHAVEIGRIIQEVAPGF